MKMLLLPSVILICISTIISCKKEVTPGKAATASINSQNISNADGTIGDNTRFGVLISGGSTDDKMEVATKFDVGYVRASIMVKDFKGRDPAVDKYLSNGFKVILNLNWDDVSSDGGRRIPVPFPTDIDTYKEKLGEVLDKYTPEVAVIENEPTTRLFHSGPIEDYITQLEAAVEVCHSKGVKVADGSIHVGFVQQVMRGGDLRGKVLDVQKLIEAYTSLDLDYVNLHTAGYGDSYPEGALQEVAEYLRAKTGKPVMSNEFSVHSSSPSLVTSMVDGFKAGRYEYVIVRSGDSAGGAVPLHRGTNLLENGIAYRDDIK